MLPQGNRFGSAVHGHGRGVVAGTVAVVQHQRFAFGVEDIDGTGHKVLEAVSVAHKRLGVVNDASVGHPVAISTVGPASHDIHII